jgi:hypothetical protein
MPLPALGGELVVRKPSFLNKRSKRLCVAVAVLSGSVRHDNKSFLVLFFKKELLSSRPQ